MKSRVQGNFRAKIFMLFCCVCFFKTSFAQLADTTATEDSSSYYYVYIPKYEWSIGVEHSYIPGMFAKDAYYPDNFEISAWINQRFYWHAGVFYIRSYTVITPADSNLHLLSDTIQKPVYFQAGLGFYAGFTLKLYLFRNTYFTPSLSILYDDYRYNADDEWSLTIGPTAAIEFFITDRFSLRADLFNFNIGIGSSGDFLLSTHRILGLGLRYSFDVKKQNQEEQ